MHGVTLVVLWELSAQWGRGRPDDREAQRFASPKYSSRVRLVFGPKSFARGPM